MDRKIPPAMFYVSMNESRSRRRDLMRYSYPDARFRTGQFDCQLRAPVIFWRTPSMCPDGGCRPNALARGIGRLGQFRNNRKRYVMVDQQTQPKLHTIVQEVERRGDAAAVVIAQPWNRDSPVHSPKIARMHRRTLDETNRLSRFIPPCPYLPLSLNAPSGNAIRHRTPSGVNSRRFPPEAGRAMPAAE